MGILLRHVLAALSFSLIAATAGAGVLNPQDGVEFTTLPTPQPAAAGKKIDVIEFFGYYCPHCHAFDPVLAAWVARQGERIAFRRIHVGFRASLLPFLQAYLTLEAMGKAEEMLGKIFHVLHVAQQPLATEEQILDFLVQQGIDRQQFLATYRSPAIQQQMRLSLRAQQAYGINGVPMLAIDGRFVISPQLLQTALGSDADPVLHAAMLQVSDALLARIASERAGGMAPARTPVTPR